MGYAGIVTVSAPAGTFATIQAAIDAATPGATVTVAAGTFAEDVNVTKQLTLRGAGIDQSIILGLKAAGTPTLNLGANNILVEGFTITRDGNNTTDWAAHPKTTGVNVGQLTSGNIL
ncbi:MAG: hypothetical protein IPI01_19520 [Ignavibacteriae bacterium]|nr:hypothetical protein [Ignavibacteriota bacterium]